MADIQLSYGSGPSIAILKTSLKAMGLKAGCSVGIEERSDGLEDEIRLHLASTASAEAARRMPRTLALCYRIFAKRTVTLTADVGGETLQRSLPPRQTSERYDKTIGDFYTEVAARI